MLRVMRHPMCKRSRAAVLRSRQRGDDMGIVELVLVAARAAADRPAQTLNSCWPFLHAHVAVGKTDESSPVRSPHRRRAGPARRAVRVHAGLVRDA